MTAGELIWLPECSDWPDRIRAVTADGDSWRALTGLANTRLDFLRTVKLDRLAVRLFGSEQPAGVGCVRLALLASSTVNHLLPGLRVGALRRGLWLDTYVCPYGQYRQELLDPKSGLHGFRPDVVLFALDARHLAGRLGQRAGEAQREAVLDDLGALWRRARETFQCQILQQTLLPVFPPLLGNNEHQMPGSAHRMVQQLNEHLRLRAEQESVDLIAVDTQAARDGLGAWHNPVLWYRAKQEVHPALGPLYGDLVARVIGAQRGRSFKCLALDLDNTLWGGVVGDDGLEGIVLGQGSALGEAFVGFQQYVKALAERGVILAVCSKNSEALALEPFDQHPEMVLRRSDIACFMANWQDKPANLRAIATRLNIGLDAIAFVDDNPFERNGVRRELPEVAVPELPEDPGLFADCLAAAGYFEALRLTREDAQRTRLYRENLSREALRSSSTDVAGYLKSLDMRLLWSRFDRPGLQRIHQLINKTNQFNLTTRRYSEAEVAALIDDPATLTLQIRLLDQFGDNGIIAILIGRRLGEAPDSLLLETWLMSCRVLGRQVEEATLNVLAQEAKAAGVQRLVGEYRPTVKNEMVREHYTRLGFRPLDPHGDLSGPARWSLDLEHYRPFDTFITLAELRI
jgi:FkbH-like protein